MSTTAALDAREGILATLLAEENFRPAEPQTVEQTGLTTPSLDGLVLKYLAVVGMSSGRGIADKICLPFGIIEGVIRGLRTRQLLVHTGSAPLNDYMYSLTDQGRERALVFQSACAYVGPAPVPLAEYLLSVEAQSIRAESPKRSHLSKAFADISIDSGLFDMLGPAVNSGAGLFLYGPPGNGKSTLARRITQCFGHYVWIPHAVVEDGQIIKVYDGAYHEVAKAESDPLLKSASYDRRWIKVRRPTVIVGGELTMDGLELRHDLHSNVCEAPLQMKSNCGCLLIDDFGRQRIEPKELLNRWIIPLENRHDFLTLPTGKKFQVPFEQLIIFSTNLNPEELVDEAFLRRIPYKIEIGDPTEEEFHRLFQLYSPAFRCEYRESAVNHLIDEHYHRRNRPFRRCQPRDLLMQIRNFCAYHERPMEMRPEYFDIAARCYFTDVLKNP
jgi:predicted ATPase with chaperone activity